MSVSLTKTTALNDLMEFDHVIHVHEDGTITDAPEGREFWAPEVDVWSGEEIAVHDGWELLTGFTGQYGYNGPAMHPSEFIGGGLERHIRETPGLYVALVVEMEGEDYDPEIGERELVGWCVAFRAMPEEHDPTCTGCKHDCPWRQGSRGPLGAPHCGVCDDHGEAFHAGYGETPCDCGDEHDGDEPTAGLAGSVLVRPFTS